MAKSHTTERFPEEAELGPIKTGLQVMTRAELVARAEPILSAVGSSVGDLQWLIEGPELDEDYKVARSSQLSEGAFDRLQLAVNQFSTAVDALMVRKS